MSVVLPILLILGLTGCKTAEEYKTLLVWSNNPDTAFFIERYNFLMDTEVDFEYIPNLVEAITQQRVEADLVIGSWVNTPTVNALMIPITSAGGSNSRPNTAWVPLAFTLPAIVYDSSGPLSSMGPVITLTELGTSLYGSDSAEEIQHPLFLPSYPPETSYVILRSLGVDFGADSNGNPVIDESTLRAGLDRLRNWQTRYHGSIDREHEYRERYLYEPWPRLLEKGRIETAYLPSDTLLGWDFFAEERWDFSFLGGEDGGLFALEDVVYAGIPLTTDAERDARAILAWLSDPDVQIDLVGQKLVQRIDSFGFFGGFSTNERVNRTMFEEIYPGLAAHRFSPEAVRLPSERARYWDEALLRVVYPALDSTQAVQLGSDLTRWYRQRGD